MKGFISFKLFLLLNFALFSTILARNLNPKPKLNPKNPVSTITTNVTNCPNGSLCLERGKCEEKFIQKNDKGKVIACSDEKICCHNSKTIADRNRRNFSPTSSTPASSYYHPQYQSPTSSKNHHGYEDHSDYESYEDPTEMYVENDDQFDDYPGEESYYSNDPLMNYKKTEEGGYSSTQNIDQNPQQQTECTPPREENIYTEPSSAAPAVDYYNAESDYYNPEGVEEIEGSGYDQEKENLGYDQYTDRSSNYDQNYNSETNSETDGYPGKNEGAPTDDADDYEPKSTSESEDKPEITTFRVPIRHIHSNPKKLKKYPIKKHMLYTSNKYDKRYNSVGRKLYNKNVNLYPNKIQNSNNKNINQNQPLYANTNKYTQTGTGSNQNQNAHSILNPSQPQPQTQTQTSPNLNQNVPVQNPQLQSNNGQITNQYPHQQQQQVYQQPQQLQQQQQQQPQQLQQQQHQRYQRSLKI